MTPKRIEAILNYVDAIIKAGNIDQCPLDINNLVKEFGGSVAHRDPVPPEKYNPNERIIPGDGRSFLIDYRITTREDINRFNLAHMLGHLFLHTNYIADGALTKEFTEDAIPHPADFEADIFAAALLMPKDKFLNIAEKNIIDSGYNTFAIGAYFGVPPRRVRSYGYLLSSFRWRDW